MIFSLYSNRLFFRLFIFLVTSYACTIQGGIWASEVVSQPIQKLPLDRTKHFEWHKGVGGSLCGAYSACTAMRRLGADVSPRGYMKSKYVGTCAGSTQDEVIAAIEDSGFVAFPANQLSILDLKLIDMPFIAFVRNSKGSDRYNHWITADYDKEAGLFRVFENGLPSYTASSAGLMARWSGSGIFVSRKGESPLLPLYAIRFAYLMVLVLIIFASMTVVSLLKTHFHPSDTVISLTRLGVMLSLMVVLILFFFGDLANCDTGVSGSIAAHASSFNEVYLEEVMHQFAPTETLLIDARREVDFAYNGLAEAVNIPVNASEEDIKKYLHGLPRDTRIVVYCQSELCNYDTTIAQQLTAIGFRNVSVAKKGIYEYLANKSKSS
ncbi:rhodanese-like domain-containing protein [Gimesia panareensis]|uniref:rhodanese-like domain-containing protein n=1 Tax=Gimesia panareensis TaxID=2527978 RepID=UPI001187D26C|nr:rhodanese-like domain-containing protein [Gimesia panareensis]QDU52148.1 Rhodanese-like domain protein [Gimesia panareensis]